MCRGSPGKGIILSRLDTGGRLGTKQLNEEVRRDHTNSQKSYRDAWGTTSTSDYFDQQIQNLWISRFEEMHTTKNLYKLLGLRKEASQEDIRLAHRRLVRKYHPDTNPEDPQAEERFKEVQQAYDILSAPQKRREYDQRLHASSRTGGTSRQGAGGTTRADPGKPHPRSAGRRAGGGATYTVDLSEVLAKLVNLSGERASGRTEGNFQLRGEEIAQLATVLGEEMSRISELLGKDTAGLLRLLNEKMKRNAKANSEEAHPGGFPGTDKDALGEKPSGTSSRKPREKKVKGPRSQGRTKTVKGPRARRNRRSSS